MGGGMEKGAKWCRTIFSSQMGFENLNFSHRIPEI